MSKIRDLEWFDSLKKRDFDNGAVLDEIAAVFKENARLQDLLVQVPPCQACLGNPMIPECKPWCKEARKLRDARKVNQPL